MVCSWQRVEGTNTEFPESEGFIGVPGSGTHCKSGSQSAPWGLGSMHSLIPNSKTCPDELDPGMCYKITTETEASSCGLELLGNGQEGGGRSKCSPRAAFCNQTAYSHSHNNSLEDKKRLAVLLLPVSTARRERRPDPGSSRFLRQSLKIEGDAKRLMSCHIGWKESVTNFLSHVMKMNLGLGFDLE